MKLTSKMLWTLLLLLTIVSTRSLKAKSQVIEPIKSDTVFCYTASENRKIAKIILERDYYKDQYSIDTAVIAEQKKVIFYTESQLQNTNILYYDLKALHESIVKDNIKKLETINNLKKQNNGLKILGISTSTSTILLLIIILL